MNTLLVLSLLIAAAMTVAAIAITVQLARGRWLFLVAGKAAFDEDPEKRGKQVRCARRMALVTGTFALLTATIIFYKLAEIAQDPTLIDVGLGANNVAFVLFIIALIAFYVMQRAYKDPLEKPAVGDSKNLSSREARMVRRAQKARVDAFSTATLTLLIGIVVCAFVLGLLFSAF